MLIIIILAILLHTNLPKLCDGKVNLLGVSSLIEQLFEISTTSEHKAGLYGWIIKSNSLTPLFQQWYILTVKPVCISSVQFTSATAEE